MQNVESMAEQQNSIDSKYVEEHEQQNEKIGELRHDDQQRIEKISCACDLCKQT
jgi:hypothetical protein